MIDVQQVRELIELMIEHGLNEIRVREGDTQISLRKGPTGEVTVGTTVPPPTAAPAPAPEPTPGLEAPSEDEGLVPIVSPMVGTVYAAPDPGSSPFVQVGSEVDVDSPVCIIEAMKVFNEIKAEVAGTIERILVQNQQAVEYGQPLMLVRPRS